MKYKYEEKVRKNCHRHGTSRRRTWCVASDDEFVGVKRKTKNSFSLNSVDAKSKKIYIFYNNIHTEYHFPRVFYNEILKILHIRIHFYTSLEFALM